MAQAELESKCGIIQHTCNVSCATQVCRQNGGIYAKAAQFASTLLQVPEEFRVELASLTDNYQAMSYDEVQAVVRSETGRSIETLFQTFARDPVAAASLAQVLFSDADMPLSTQAARLMHLLLQHVVPTLPRKLSLC